MSKKNELGIGGKAAIAGAIGSAAVAAALLFVSKKKKDEKLKSFTTPFDEQPETD
ncbi:Na+-driven multidrug efflux pump [Altererythrobacter atlanticus]|uniref:Uncharacterized protein n=1 Tax=Croceibacterium atlanticum TaxID=1267766 RepID=A0A0F7KQJ2_9SPHN|nr:isopropylmalate isomerase [Croceibacterium atlanticum]AKH41075.1 hypothetical protein WYH_00008 [Croceibacterium atlanticum]MBB5732590.1 Na+-driven multidrug efflux pump [Croceibacterium atlanticum]